MTGFSTLVEPDQSTLARTAAGRLVTAVSAAQRARGLAHVVLTGGSGGSALLEAVGDSPQRDEIDWSQLVLWWGDERFLPAGHPDRNAQQAHDALLGSVPLNPDHVHPMPAADGPDGGRLAAAAARYADQLAAASGGAGPCPAFDVAVLGVGPDAHVASLFPGHPALRETGRSVVALHDSPKPPPTRITMTRPTLCAAREVWFLVSGPDKAAAVALARSGAAFDEAPAGGVRGRKATLWMLDQEAAARLG